MSYTGVVDVEHHGLIHHNVTVHSIGNNKIRYFCYIDGEKHSVYPSADGQNHTYTTNVQNQSHKIYQIQDYQKK